jgi:hypothetical protein
MRKFVLVVAAGLALTTSAFETRLAAAAELGVSPRVVKKSQALCDGYPCRRTYVRTRGNCEIIGACSQFGAYGPDGGPRFWGAYTGWGPYTAVRPYTGWGPFAGW